MNISIAHRPWTASPAASPASAWRFAVELDEAGRGRTGWLWQLRRPWALAPSQLIGGYLVLCLVSISVAAAMWWQGARYVLGFAAVELLALGAALVFYARHAADCETITLSGGDMAVVHRRGRAIERNRFRAEWVRVEPTAAEGSLVELSGEGRLAHVGRYLRPELRGVLAGELRRALRLSRDLGTRNPEDH